MGGSTGFNCRAASRPCVGSKCLQSTKSLDHCWIELIRGFDLLRRKCRHRYTGPPYACLEDRMSDA